MTPRPVAAEDLLKLRFVADPRIAPDGSKIAYTVTQIEEESKAYRTELWLTGMDGGKAYRITREGSRPAWSPDGEKLAYLTERSGTKQVWLMPNGFGEAEQLTTLRYGVSELSWSPDGQKLLVVSPAGSTDDPDRLRKEMTRDEKDKENKERSDQPLVVERLRYKLDDVGLLPRRKGQLWVIDASTRDAIQITSGEYDLKSPVWSPDGKYIAFTSNCLADPDAQPAVADLYLVSAIGGEPLCLTGSDGTAALPAWSPDGQELAFLWSNRQYRLATLPQLYRIRVAGGAAQALTQTELSIGVPANSDVRYGPASMAPVWTAEGWIYFAAAARGYTQLYRVPAGGGEIAPVSQVKGAIYGFTFDRAGSRAALAVAEPLSPGEVYGLNPEQGESRRLTDINDGLLSGLLLSTPEEFWCDGADGWPVQGWVMPPVGVEPGKQYPAVLEIHGGPHTMFGDVFFYEFQLLCSQGYAVVYANPRGSHGYGQEFVAACCDDYGGKDYQDLLAAMDSAMARWDGIDPNRLGVTGGSYGGFMTNWIVGQTDRFRAAVTQRSISNWLSFAGVSDIGFYFTEEELGINPWEDPDKLVRFSPLTYAKNINTPLLIIHSEQDLRCPMEQAEQLFIVLKRSGKTVKFLRFPGASHELSRSGKPVLRVERLKAIAGWFGEHLKAEGKQE